MIGLDTNLLLRAVAIDDVRQTPKARDFIARECTVENPGFVSTLVLLESAWVLEKAYGFSRSDLAQIVDDLLSIPAFAVENRDAVRSALDIFQNQPIEFSDALIGEVNRAAGCSAMATFDRKAASLKGFRRVP